MLNNPCRSRVFINICWLYAHFLALKMAISDGKMACIIIEIGLLAIVNGPLLCSKRPSNIL